LIIWIIAALSNITEIFKMTSNRMKLNPNRMKLNLGVPADSSACSVQSRQRCCPCIDFGAYIVATNHDHTPFSTQPTSWPRCRHRRSQRHDLGADCGAAYVIDLHAGIDIAYVIDLGLSNKGAVHNLDLVYDIDAAHVIDHSADYGAANDTDFSANIDAMASGSYSSTRPAHFHGGKPSKAAQTVNATSQQQLKDPLCWKFHDDLNIDAYRGAQDGGTGLLLHCRLDRAVHNVPCAAD
jgi:hypothetical protein